MAITDITTSEEFIAGAPNIKLKGDLRPNQVAARDPEEGVMEFDEEVITPYDLQKEEGVNIGPMAGMGNVMKLFQTPYGFDESAFEDMLIQYKDSGAKEKGIKLYEFATDFLGMVEKGDPSEENMKMASDPGIEDSRNQLSIKLFGKELNRLSEEERDILDDEAQRQMQKFGAADGGRVQYGLGSLVKSIGKTAKKVAKSPIGKAALLYAAGFGIPGTNFGGLLGTSAGSMFGARQGMFGTYGPVSALQNLGIMKSVGDANMAATRTGPLAKFFGSKGALAGAGIGLASILSAADVDTSNPSEMPRSTEELQALLRRGYKNLNPRADEVEVEEFVRVNSANGGRIGYAFGTPDTARAAGIMGNLPVRQNKAGVSEVDLRDTGGFIPPVGVKEKADDVPAMLSNNEFVMTADAVRAAGGGSVNVGAQRMYDLMKNLESRIA